jgi:hypothetical protein
MKKLFFISAFFLLISFTTADEILTAKERNDAISYFKEAQKNLEKELKGLSEAQLNWKPADSVWSVANCVEHIAISEKNIFDWAMSTLKAPADPTKRAEVKNTDDAIKAMVSSRERKVKTQEAFVPTGQFGTTAQTLAVFAERRAANINYIKTTQDDLRNHYSQSPVGLMDAYQVLLFLNAHTRRHTLQIIEVKSHPDFPKQ